jgi:hypothetical protein
MEWELKWKNKGDENFKTTISSKTFDRQKQLENVDSIKYSGSMLTNDERCNCEIKSKIDIAKAVFNRKVAL